MPTYVVLYKFTDDGAKNIKGTVQRARDARAENDKRGFKTQGIYWTQGQYDIATIVDAPDDTSVTALLMSVGALGNVRTQTLRAFSPDEMGQILGKMR